MSRQEYQILVTVGTDHHQFTRLIDWLDRWLRENPSFREACLVQHGQTRQSEFAENISFIPFSNLMELMRGVRVVITHGGPATIFESRGNARMPLCVPRVPELREIVDDHQVRFARYLAREKLVLLCGDENSFITTLERAISDPLLTRVTEESRRNTGTIENLEVLMNDLARRGRPNLGRFKRPRSRV